MKPVFNFFTLTFQIKIAMKIFTRKELLKMKKQKSNQF